MKHWDSVHDSAIYQDILQLKSASLSKYALESFALLVDGATEGDLLRGLIISHAEIARRLETTVKQLETSERMLNEAQQIARIGRWDIDYRTNTRSWSDSLYDILQVDRSLQPSRELFVQRIHPDDISQVNAISQKLLSSRETWMDRYRIVMPDGAIRWVHLRMQTEFDENGSPIHSYGTIQDITAMKAVEDELERYSKHLEEIVSEKVKEISESQMATIYALVKLAESRDDDTGAHIERTAGFCRLLAEKARALPEYAQQIGEEFIATIYRSSPLHDIGKVGISDGILLKPGKLTPEEFAIMKTHVEIGYQTLKNVEGRYQNNAFIKMGLDITRYHHEKWDGSGYLFGLKETAIPLSARMMAISDVYDALRSRRVYKEPYSHEKSAGIIWEGRGSHFDPALVDLFIVHQEEFRALYDMYS